MSNEAVLSSASLIQDGDKLVRVKVVLYVTVNKSAYEREYGEVTVGDLKYGTREDVVGALEASATMSSGTGIYSDVEEVS